MLNRQNFNGYRGETRSEAILADHFWIHTLSVDVEGRDLMVEIPGSIEELAQARTRIKVMGIVQAKFFEGNNEVRIARQYVEDAEGIKTDFFVLLHTDEKEKWQHYFFTANQIVAAFELKTDKNDKEYYVFRLSSRRKFLKYKGIPYHTINDIIKQHINRTEEFRNAEFIKAVEKKWFDPDSVLKKSNKELFATLKGKHIVDKLYVALNSYHGFRRMHAWRLVSKISFKNKITDTTTYHDLIMTTTNQEIIDFFSNITLDSGIQITNPSFFSGVENAEDKVRFIVSILIENNITSVDFRNEKIPIVLESTTDCDCAICCYEALDFKATENALQDIPSSNWEGLSAAYGYFGLGKFTKAMEILRQVKENADNNKEPIISFICSYNIEQIGRKIVADEINLFHEVLKLNISADKRDVLKHLADYTLLQGYLNRIDDIYLKVKEFRQRTNNNSTLSLIQRQRAAIIECLSFYKGNRLFITEDFGILFEKHIESCIISLSMQAPYRSHLGYFDDFILECIVQYCDPDKLLLYFQRNGVKSVTYKSDSGYFSAALENFFSVANINYLKDEIGIKDDKVENYTLRRHVGRVFSVLCILLDHLEIPVSKAVTEGILCYAGTLDFTIDDIALLAHPILANKDFIGTTDILSLLRILLLKEDNNGYLIANCLYGLSVRNYSLLPEDQDISEAVQQVILDTSAYNTMQAFIKVAGHQDIFSLSKKVMAKLDGQFDGSLYYEACITDLLQEPSCYFTEFFADTKKILEKKSYRIMENYDPYTGINNYVMKKLYNYAELYYRFNDQAWINSNVHQKVCEAHPLFLFILTIDSFTDTDGVSFEKEWLLQLPHALLKKLAANSEFCLTLKRDKIYLDKKLQDIYLRYFI